MPDWRKVLLGERPFHVGLIMPLAGALLFHYGVLAAYADLFMEDWARRSLGRPDIFARGPFILGAFLPFVAAASAPAFALVSYVALPRQLRSVLGGLVASVIGAVLVLLGMMILPRPEILPHLSEPWTAVPGTALALAGVTACLIWRKIAA
jgi:hypothetical protein